MCMSENIKEIMPGFDRTLKSLLLLFDRYVLKEKDGKIQFSGEVFEYSFTCEVVEAELVSKIGEFLVTVPKYMWNLKKQDYPIQEK